MNSDVISDDLAKALNNAFPVHFAAEGMNQGKRGLYFQFPCKPGQWTKVEDTTRWNTDSASVTCPDCIAAMADSRWFK